MSNILNYQKTDAEINKLNKIIDKAEELNQMAKLNAFVKEAQSKSTFLENSAQKLIDEYEELKSLHDNSTKNINELIKNDVSDLGKEKLDEYIKNVNELSSELFMLERNFNMLITKIGNKLKEFEATVKNAKKARARYKEIKSKYEEKVQGVEPERKKLQNTLKELEKNVSAELLAKYKTIKQDGIFPVFVPLVDKGCGYCGMSIPSAKFDILKTSDYIPCEHCRRMIYNLNKE